MTTKEVRPEDTVPDTTLEVCPYSFCSGGPGPLKETGGSPVRVGIYCRLELHYIICLSRQFNPENRSHWKLTRRRRPSRVVRLPLPTPPKDPSPRPSTFLSSHLVGPRPPVFLVTIHPVGIFRHLPPPTSPSVPVAHCVPERSDLSLTLVFGHESPSRDVQTFVSPCPDLARKGIQRPMTHLFLNLPPSDLRRPVSDLIRK